MAKNQFAEPHFHDEAVARAWFEAARWPNGPICSNCGRLKRYATMKAGLYRCGEPTCRKDFTVKTTTGKAGSHAALTQWTDGVEPVTPLGKNGFSATSSIANGCDQHGLVSAYRIREAIRRGGLDLPTASAGTGKFVEADETYSAREENKRRNAQLRAASSPRAGVGPAGKRVVIALVERGGRVRSFHPASVPTRRFGQRYRARRTSPGRSRLHTDEFRLYILAGSNLRPMKTSRTRTANMFAAT